jgi:hypothetical protein
MTMPGIVVDTKREPNRCSPLADPPVPVQLAEHKHPRRS